MSDNDDLAALLAADDASIAVEFMRVLLSGLTERQRQAVHDAAAAAVADGGSWKSTKRLENVLRKASNKQRPRTTTVAVRVIKPHCKPQQTSTTETACTVGLNRRPSTR